MAAASRRRFCMGRCGWIPPVISHHSFGVPVWRRYTFLFEFSSFRFPANNNCEHFCLVLNTDCTHWFFPVDQGNRVELMCPGSVTGRIAIIIVVCNSYLEMYIRDALSFELRISCHWSLYRSLLSKVVYNLQFSKLLNYFPLSFIQLFCRSGHSVDVGSHTWARKPSTRPSTPWLSFWWLPVCELPPSPRMGQQNTRILTQCTAGSEFLQSFCFVLSLSPVVLIMVPNDSFVRTTHWGRTILKFTFSLESSCWPCP